MTAAGRASRSVDSLAVVAGVALLHAVVLFWILRKDYWAYDDWYYWVIAERQGPFTRGDLLSVHFNHVAPGYRAVTSATGKLMPFDYRWLVALFVAGQAASAVLLQRILDLLFGVRWLHVAAAVALSGSVLLLGPIQWFSAALQSLPTIFFGLLCVYAHLRWVAGGGARWNLVAAGSLGLGLLFYERPALVVVYLLLIQALFISRSLDPRVVWRDLVAQRSIWQSYLIVLGTYAGLYVGKEVWVQGAEGGPGGIGETLEMLWNGWAGASWTALMGLDGRPNADGTKWLMLLAGQALFGGLVAWSLLRRRSAWRGWAFLLVTFCVGLGAIGFGRLDQFGPDLGYDSRYVIDMCWLLPFGIAAAFAPSARADPAAHAGASRRLALPVGWVPAVVAVAVAATFVVGVFTARRMHRGFAGVANRAYVERIVDGLRSQPADAVVVDVPTPMSIQNSFGDYWLGEVMQYIAPGRRVDGPIGPGGLLSVGDNGAVSRGRLDARASGAAVAEQRAGRLTVFDAAGSRASGDALCITARPEGRALVEWRFPAAVQGPRLVLQADSPARRTPLALALLSDPGTGYGRPTRFPLVAAAAGGASVLATRQDVARAIQLEVPPGAQWCVRRLAIGSIA